MVEIVGLPDFAVLIFAHAAKNTACETVFDKAISASMNTGGHELASKLSNRTMVERAQSGSVRVIGDIHQEGHTPIPCSARHRRNPFRDIPSTKQQLESFLK